MKNKVVVRIGGKDYTVVGQESDEYMQKVGLYIDKKMNEILRGSNKLSTAMASVLTAINVADDYFKTIEAYESIEDEYSKILKENEKIKSEIEELNRKLSRASEKIQESEIQIARLETQLKRG